MANIICRPNNPNNTHELMISGKGRTFGIKLERGSKSIVEAPIRASNIEKSGGVKKYGDFDPSFAHIEMRTWEGGRGGEFLSDDPSKYFDGYGWTLSPGVWHQSPQWAWGEGYYNADNLMPGAKRRGVGNSVKWHPLVSTNHVARSFVDQGLGYDMKRIQSWVRRIGTPPAPMIARLHVGQSTGSTAATRPSTHIAAFATLESSACEPLESFVWETSVTTAATGTTHPSTMANTTQASSGNYWMELYTTAAGTDANHWEVGYNSSAADSGSSAMKGNGTSAGWSASTVHFYFRVTPEPMRRKWHIFEMDRATYAIDERKDGTSDTHMLINGDRGQCEGSSAATTAGLIDTSKAWTAGRWTDATVAIIRGPGSGQTARITNNSASSLACSWDIAPTSASEYVIYDTLEWTPISSAIVSSVGMEPARDVAVGGNVAYVAFGPSTKIGMFTWATSIHKGDKSEIANSSIADFLAFFSDPALGPQVYRALSSAGTVSRAALQGFSTQLTFKSSVQCGGAGYAFTNLLDYNDEIYALKEDSFWSIKNEKPAKINIGLDAFASSNNGRAACAQNLYLLANWSHSVERIGKGLVDDIGPWRGPGLKEGHQGPVSVLVPAIAWTLAGIDAGTTGRSCVMAWNGMGWHEIYRAHTTGYQVENAYFQANSGGRPRLWVSVGGDLVSMQFPKNTLNPRNDKEIHYQHECVMETGTIDMDAVQLKKLFGNVYAVTKNLASTQASICAEYQLDDKIGSTQWIPLGAFNQSPVDFLSVNRGDKHAIRMRYRGLTENSTVPSEMHAAVIKGVARTPTRRQWTIRAVTGDFSVDAQGMPDADPDDFYMWLQDVAVATEPLLVHAAWEAMDGVYVYAEHPVLNRDYTTPDGAWGGALALVLKEIEE